MLRKIAIGPVLLLVTQLAACASAPPPPPRPEFDMAEVRRLLNCPGSRIPVCTQHIGKPTRCFCADQDAMEEILDPYVRQ